MNIKVLSCIFDTCLLSDITAKDLGDIFSIITSRENVYQIDLPKNHKVL